MAQTILLGAVEQGLGGCIIASVKKENLQELLNLPVYLKVALVIVLGKPIEKVVIDDIDDTGSVIYWRDSEQVHHVPK